MPIAKTRALALLLLSGSRTGAMAAELPGPI